MTIRNVHQKNHVLLQKLAKECKPLDVHTPYTYWVNATYHSKCSFILEDASEPVGYLMAIETPEIIFLWQIGIIPTLRKKGYSHILIDSCVEYAKSTGKDIELTIDALNQNSNEAFKAYCSKHEYRMEELKEQAICDDADDLYEKEVLYHIHLTKD